MMRPGSLDSMRALPIRLLVLIGLAAAVRVAAYHGPLQRLDVRAIDALHLTYGSLPHRLATVLVQPFDPGWYALIFVAVVGAALWKGRIRDAVAAAGLMLGAAATTQVLKHVVAA